MGTGTQIWCPRTENSLDPGGRNIDCSDVRLVLKMSYVGCLGLSPVIPAQVTLQLFSHFFGISRSFKVIDIGTPGKLVSAACYDEQQVCVYLQLFSR